MAFEPRGYWPLSASPGGGVPWAGWVVRGGPLCTQHSSSKCGSSICPTYPCPVVWAGVRQNALAPQVSTAEDNGILLYNGDNDHIAVELYQGHVRVSYDPGSYPSSAIYR